jgi:general secretion pathway protein I
LWRSARPSRAPEAGFTLVEALAALAVLTMGLAAIGSLTNAGVRSSLRAERHLAQVSAARAVLSELPARNVLPFGRLTGTLDGHAWRVDATAIATTAEPQRSAEWVPQGIALLVRSPSGSVVEVDTIRLRRTPTR